ncbi:hypothetical protein ACFX2B_006349 [Malus domestica]
MGFQNLYAFNLAVLAKQDWRIVQNLKSLTTRLFKAMHFPNTPFWDALVPSSFSYCWSSILKVRMVLEKGSRWLIGDGASIRVWRDRWVPRLSTFRPITMLPLFREDMRVHELIDVERKTWCDAKLTEFFEEEYKEHICALPIS